MGQKKSFPIWTTLLVLGGLSLGGAVWAGKLQPTEWLSRLMGPSKTDYSNLVTKVAEKKSFLISLSVQGYLDSLGNNTLSSGVEGTTTIFWIAPEGKIVAKDEVVCELDAALLREKAKQQEITATQADAAESKAKGTLEITKTQNKSDIAAAELKRTLAKIDLEKYTDKEKGEYKQQVNELKGNVEIANEEQVRAKENYEFTKQQVKKGYHTQNQLEANRIAVKQSDLKVLVAKDKLEVLEVFTQKRTITELEANAEELVFELDRVNLKCTSAETQASKDYDAQKLTAAAEHEKLDRLNKQIEACTMKAPIAGQVVYANMQSSNFGRSSGETIEQGATVRERQAIINLPDVTQMKVDCRIHESLIGNIRLNLPARIKIDAFPARMFKGVVAHVSSVPMSGRWPNTDLKEYETEIKLIDDPEVINKLRPGLTAQVEILVDSRENVLQVPLQAVLAVADKQMAYVLTGQGPERRELVVGQSNQSHVEIKSGIQAGELVIMNARSQFGEEISLLEAELNANKAKTAPVEIIPPAPVPPAGATDGGPAGPTRSGPPGGAGGGPDRTARFTQMDKNGDGQLSLDEADERIKPQFSTLDKDSNGSVSREEYLSAPRPPRGGPEGTGGPRPN